MTSASTNGRRGAIGILGLQGCFTPHQRKLEQLGWEARRIVYPDDLGLVDGLIFPGGETTTMLKTMTPGLWEALAEFGKRHPIWGICAGCILLATKVTHPQQNSLSLVDIDVVRNAYGAQNESFIADLRYVVDQQESSIEAIFIRAPKVSRIGDDVAVLASHEGNAVLLETDLHFISTFHPELTPSTELHEHFLTKVGRYAQAGRA